MNQAKRILGAVMACQLLGLSINATAAKCPNGLIEGKDLGSLRVKGKACYVFDSVIRGRVSVTDSPRFLIHGSRIHGQIVVRGGEDIGIVENVIKNDKILIRDTTGNVHFASNEVKGNSNVVFQGNRSPETEVLVYGNEVSGNLKCKRNTLQVAVRNAVSGNHDCSSRRAPLTFKRVEWTIDPDDGGPGVHTIFMIADVSPLAVNDVQNLGGRLVWNETEIELCTDPALYGHTFISIRDVGDGFLRIGDGFQTNYQGRGCAINDTMASTFNAYGFPKKACLSVTVANVNHEICAPLEVID